MTRGRALLEYWRRTQQAAMCSECAVDIVAPIEERAAQLCEDGRQRYGDVDQLGNQSQTDFVEQQNLAWELLDMDSQLESPAESS